MCAAWYYAALREYVPQPPAALLAHCRYEPNADADTRRVDDFLAKVVAEPKTQRDSELTKYKITRREYRIALEARYCECLEPLQENARRHSTLWLIRAENDLGFAKGQFERDSAWFESHPEACR